MVLPLTLKSNDVFVFQSNSNGFHGSGSAGWAYRGSAKDWRIDEQFIEDWNSGIPCQGKWNILRCPYGLQQGKDGTSWGIITTTWADQPISIPLDKIAVQLMELAKYSIENPTNNFLFAKIGTGHAGHITTDINEIFLQILNMHPQYPQNWFTIKKHKTQNFHFTLNTKRKYKEYA